MFKVQKGKIKQSHHFWSDLHITGAPLTADPSSAHTLAPGLAPSHLLCGVATGICLQHPPHGLFCTSAPLLPPRDPHYKPTCPARPDTGRPSPSSLQPTGTPCSSLPQSLCMDSSAARLSLFLLHPPETFTEPQGWQWMDSQRATPTPHAQYRADSDRAMAPWPPAGTTGKACLQAAEEAHRAHPAPCTAPDA